MIWFVKVFLKLFWVRFSHGGNWFLGYKIKFCFTLSKSSKTFQSIHIHQGHQSHLPFYHLKSIQSISSIVKKCVIHNSIPITFLVFFSRFFFWNIYVWMWKEVKNKCCLHPIRCWTERIFFYLFLSCFSLRKSHMNTSECMLEIKSYQKRELSCCHKFDYDVS